MIRSIDRIIREQLISLAQWRQLEATGHSNNYLLNLTDNTLPGNYPLPPGNANFTVLNGQAARDFWADPRLIG